MSAWVLIGEGYGGEDYTIGVFDTLADAQSELVYFLQERVARHPSNRALLDRSYVAEFWAGRELVESWTKDGAERWLRVLP